MQSSLGPGSHASTRHYNEEDPNIVSMWLQIKPRRWVAGVVAGVVAGFVFHAVGFVLSSMGRLDPLFSVKVAALPVLGSRALDLGASGIAIITGLVMTGIVTGILGLAFAHFTLSNRIRTLLAMGVVWGVFGWIFIMNLFIQSFHDVSALRLSNGATFAACLGFGIGLVSLAATDRIFGGTRQPSQ